ncbi:MAG: alpha/beta fold hydrolase [Burkholderiales bacterium]
MPHWTNTQTDVSIYYEESGSGFPLLLLPPGGLNAAIGVWQRTAFAAPQVFSRHYRVIAIDERNAGASTGPVDADRPWDCYADDHLGLMNHLGIERFHVLGCCIGCSHALNLVRLAPERVTAAVLEQPVGIDDGNRTTMPNLWVEWAAQMQKKHPGIDRAQLETFGKRMWGGDFVLSVTREWLATCQTPLLVLPGIDAPHPTAIGREVAALAPNAQSIEPWKEPASLIPSIIERIRQFLDAHTPV